MRLFFTSLFLSISLLGSPLNFELAYTDEAVAIVIYGLEPAEEIWIEAQIAEGLLWTALGLFEVDDQGLIDLKKFSLLYNFNKSLEDS
jgi:hypothetical protein